MLRLHYSLSFLSEDIVWFRKRQPYEGGQHMLEIHNLEEGLGLFKTLGSEVRLKIVWLLARNGEMNLNEIAGALGLTNGAITSHIRKLEECGMIRIHAASTGRGSQKRCALVHDRILLNMLNTPEEKQTKVYETVIRVGQYTDYAVNPPCGVVTAKGPAGGLEGVRSFAHPDRFEGELLWFHDGYVEYRIPNLLPPDNQIVQLTISAELSSAEEGPSEEHSSEITFYLNGMQMGTPEYFQPQDATSGIFSPAWWKNKALSHGNPKLIVFNRSGVFMEGRKASSSGLGDMNLDETSDLRLRLETRPGKLHHGGCAIFGSGFGNYHQDIVVRVHYMPSDQTAVREAESKYSS